jgi:ABC-2 type transport system ATP-binding protein
MPLIELRNITRLYGQVIGVNDMTLSLEPGAHGLLGPNGAGKTTLLNLLIGQLKPTLGTVRVLDEQPRNNPELARRIGFCPGSEGFYATVSGFEWVRYLQQLQGMTRLEADAAAARAMDLVGMTDSMHRLISTYSRGMRQRTKLAQAIAHNPELLILDEPFNGLDPIARHDMTLLLRKWIDEGKSLILASHVLHEVESITRSFLLISGGRLLASGAADEIKRILAELPNEILLRCDRPRELAALMLQRGAIDSVKFDDRQLQVATHQPGRLLSELPAWLAETGIHVSEVASADESLQTLFDSLMRIHRGEMS